MVARKLSAITSPVEFAKKVSKVIQGTERGDYFEVILSQSFSIPFSGKPRDLFEKISAINPSPYMFLINLGDEHLVGSSPEIYVRVTGKSFETCPISGTLPRGETALEDAEQVKALISSEKEEAELTMCTDVDRNDMARVCVPGSVKILGRRQLEFYSHLIHTVDHLQGELAEGFDGLCAFQAHMWACTVTGAPKPAAVQEIENMENSPRQWYSGAVGFISVNGDINTGITLRTAHLRGGRASVRAGATILYDSVPELEERETRVKAAAFLSALRDKSKGGGSLGKQVNDKNVSSRACNGIKVFVVDCRDSFSHNLASYLRELGAEVITYRPGFPFVELKKAEPDLVFLSPGPGRPEDFSLNELIGQIVKEGIPLFGVCLGHQALGEYFGATLMQMPAPKHGKISTVSHCGDRLFSGIEKEFSVGRYHSLYLDAASMPECLSITASSSVDNIVMAIRHKSYPAMSVQFHPESLMSLKGRVGHLILENCLRELS